MSRQFRFVEAHERAAAGDADRLGALLGASPAWVGPFIVLLGGLNFQSVPSMTQGATFFEAATAHDEQGRLIIAALDDLYREIRDGYSAAHAHGEILERFVWHVLGEHFPDRLGPCGLEVDGIPDSSFRLDAATHAEPPAVGVEAKTSTRALLRKSRDRASSAAKAAWVVSLASRCDGQMAGAFATWSIEQDFRNALAKLIGPAPAQEATVIAHEQLTQLPRRLAAAVRHIERVARTREQRESAS
jgi:hypothetical protein